MPAAFVTDNLTAMLRGPLADTLTCGSSAAGCLFDDSQSIVEDGMGFDVTKRLRVATIQTGSVSGLWEDAAVTVTDTATGTATAYVVRKVLPMEDGKLSRVILAEADA